MFLERVILSETKDLNISTLLIVIQSKAKNLENTHVDVFEILRR